MRALIEKKVLFFGGKGGVGKTTCAAARAVTEAAGGARVLVVPIGGGGLMSGVAIAASRRDCSETRDAVPPMWKVRIVSCVPGSPIDCAAITPVASPNSTNRPEARLRP